MPRTESSFRVVNAKTQGNSDGIAKDEKPGESNMEETETLKPKVSLPKSKAQQRKKATQYLNIITQYVPKEKAPGLPEDEVRFRSKYSGFPGSVHAPDVDFKKNQSYFGPEHISKNAKGAKEQVFRMRQARRLGVSKAWNSSVHTDESPCVRPLIRQLSAYQSERLDIDPRAQEVPDFYKKTLFIGKSNKFEVDKEPFLSDKEKKKIIRNNLVAHHEMEKFTQRMKRPWNISTEVTETELRERDEKLRTTITSTKKSRERKVPKNYTSPIQREKQWQDEIRQKKRQSRNVKQDDIQESVDLSDLHSRT